MHVETEISRLRDITRNYENYIPLLRPLYSLAARLRLYDGDYMPSIGRRRAGYHRTLLEKLRKAVAAGADRPCIQGNVLRDPDSRGLTEAEILSVSLSMMAGADTSQPTLAWAILLLARRPDVQARAYRAIADADPELLASPEVAHSRVEYVDAFTKEISRYFTALKIALPRATHGNATWQGATIPAKTMLFLNSWACSRGKQTKLVYDPPSPPVPTKTPVNRKTKKQTKQTKPSSKTPTPSRPSAGSPQTGPTSTSSRSASGGGCVRRATWRTRRCTPCFCICSRISRSCRQKLARTTYTWMIP